MTTVTIVGVLLLATLLYGLASWADGGILLPSHKRQILVMFVASPILCGISMGFAVVGLSYYGIAPEWAALAGLPVLGSYVWLLR